MVYRKYVIVFIDSELVLLNHKCITCLTPRIDEFLYYIIVCIVIRKKSEFYTNGNSQEWLEGGGGGYSANTASYIEVPPKRIYALVCRSSPCINICVRYNIPCTDIHITRNKKFSPKNKKDLGMACTSYSTSRKSKETRGNAITQPRSHPLKKCRI